MEFASTKDYGVDRLKIVIYGPAGSGKTRLAATTGDPSATIIVSAEAGLLSLRGEDIAVAEVKSLAELRAVYAYLRKGDHPYRWVIVDSISEIAEVCLGEEKRSAKDPRAAYGQMAEVVVGTLRAFRDLPCHVVFTAKQDRTQTEGGAMLYGPSMPGKQLGPAVGYLVDEMFALRVTKGDDGALIRSLQTGPDGVYDAKDRSGSLQHYEPADLSAIAAKILGAAKRAPAVTAAKATAPRPAPVAAAPAPSATLADIDDAPDDFIRVTFGIPADVTITRATFDAGRIAAVREAWDGQRGASWREKMSINTNEEAA